MNRLSRPTALKIAALLSFLLGVAGFILAIPFLYRGEDSIAIVRDAPPFFIIVSSFIFAIMRIVGAYGVWTNHRWGIVVTILVNMLAGILALPGIFIAPTLEFRLSAMISVTVGVVIIILCLWRDRRPVPA